VAPPAVSLADAELLLSSVDCEEEELVVSPQPAAKPMDKAISSANTRAFFIFPKSSLRFIYSNGFAVMNFKITLSPRGNASRLLLGSELKSFHNSTLNSQLYLSNSQLSTLFEQLSTLFIIVVVGIETGVKNSATTQLSTLHSQLYLLWFCLIRLFLDHLGKMI
jgi:hypothetical protein